MIYVLNTKYNMLLQISALTVFFLNVNICSAKQYVSEEWVDDDTYVHTAGTWESAVKKRYSGTTWEVIEDETCPYDTQDFTAYYEVDSDGAISVTSDIITATDVHNNENNWVRKDFGDNYFSSDFTVQVTVNITDNGDSATLYIVGMADSYYGIWKSEDDGTPVIYLKYYGNNNDDGFYLGSGNGTDGTVDFINGISFDTDYYITFSRDDTDGVAGSIRAIIRTGSHSGTIFATLNVDIPDGQRNDYQYLYFADMRNSTLATNTTGSVSYANLKLCL